MSIPPNEINSQNQEYRMSIIMINQLVTRVPAQREFIRIELNVQSI